MIMTIGAEFWQRIYAAKNNKVARISLILTGTIFSFLGVLVVLVGLSVKSSFPDIVPTTALVIGFQRLLSGYLLGFGLVLLFATIMSSADTFLFVLSSSLAKDFLGKLKKYSQQELTTNIKFFTIILGILGMLISIVFNDVIDIVTSLYGISFALFPATIFSFWFKLKSKVVMLSIILGVLGSIFAFSFMGISIESAIVSFPISLISLGLGQSIVKIKK